MLTSAQSLGTLVVNLTANASKYLRDLQTAENATKRAEQTITKSMKRASKATVLALGAIGVAATFQFSKFDDAMTKSTAIMSGMNAELRAEMEKTARELSMRSVTSAEQLAESYFFLASAGLDAKQSMGALPIVQKFGTAGAFDMARATDLLTDAQSSLGLSVKDTTENMANMTRVGDVLIKANTLANATAEQFATSLTTKSGSALKLLNKDVEEGVAVLAAWADQGVKGELAGERLSIVLRDLQTAFLRNTEAWNQMGLRVADAQGNLLPMVEIIRQLEDALDPMSDLQKKATLTMLGFQDRSQSALVSLLGLSDKIQEYEDQLRSAGGTMDRVNDEQMKSFASQMQILMNVLNNIVIQIGQQLAPTVLQFATALKQALYDGEELKSWVTTTAAIFSGAFLPVLAAATTALLLMGVLKAAAGFVALSKAIWVTVTATKALTAAQMANPLIAVGAIIAGTVVAFTDLSASVSKQSGLIADQTEQVESLGDAWARADRIAKGTTMFGDFDKEVAFLQKRIKDASKDRDALLNLLESNTLPDASTLPAYAQRGQQTVQGAMRNMQIAQAVVDQLKKDLEDVQALANEASAMDMANRIIEGNQTTLERARAELAKLQAAFDPTAANADVLAKAIEILNTQIEELEEKARRSAESFIDFDAEATKLRDSLDSEFKTAIKDIDLYNRLLQQGKITTAEFRQASENAMGGPTSFTNMLPGQLPGFDNPFSQISHEEMMLQQSYERQLELIRNNEQLLGETKQQIMESMEAEYNAKMRGFQDQRRDIIMQGGADIMDGLLGLTKEFAGEQSGLYKAMFAASKAFAIAEAVIKIQQGIASAAALPFPANLAAIGTVISATSGIVSTISGTQMRSFEGGGFTGSGDRVGGMDGKGGFAAMLHPNEVVTDMTKMKRAGSAPTVNIYNLPGQGADTQTSADGQTIEITIKRTKQEIASEIQRGAGSINKALDVRDRRKGGRS